jgi:photosystem II stability/assembly factor-like uncharacterized protein
LGNILNPTPAVQKFRCFEPTFRDTMRWLLCSFSFLFFAACGKDPVALPVFKEISMPVEEDLTAVCFRDSLRGAATGGTAWQSGLILSTDDGGATWRVDTTLDRKMEHVTFDAEGQAYAVGQDRTLYRPSNGANWAAYRIDYQWNKSCAFVRGGPSLIVSGGGYQGGNIQVFDPDAFWEVDTLVAVANALSDVCWADSATACAVGYGWVLRSADAGRTWQRLDVTGDFFQSVHFPTPRIGYLCGASGTILKSTDGGATWRTLRRGGTFGARPKAFRTLHFVDAERGWVVGDAGIFWQTDDGGAHWRTVAGAPADADFTHVYALGKKGWATAQKGRFFYFEH